MATAINQNGLVVHYMFDEGIGTSITDHGPNGYTGTIASATGAWGRSAGDGSGIIHMDDGQTNYMTAATIPFQSTFTAMIAFRTPQADKGWNKINGLLHDRQASTNGWSCHHGGTSDPKQFVFQVFNSSVAATLSRNFERYHDAWIIVHIAFGSSVMYLQFEDGVRVSQAGAMSTATADIEVGRLIANNAYRSNDDFADVAIWNRVLTKAEMDANVREVRKRLDGMVAPVVVPTGLTWPSTKRATGSNGTHALEGASWYTPLCTDPATQYHYVASLNADGGDSSRLEQYDSSWNLLDTATLRTATYNSNIGHRGASVAVSPAGTVIAIGHGHNPDGFRGQYTTTPGDLSTLDDIAEPTGFANATPDGFDYFRLYTKPGSGEIFLLAQGDTQRCYLHQWNDSTNAFDVVQNPLTSYGASITSYDEQIAWGPDGTMYLLTAHVNANGGFPRAWIGMIKSADDGATWTDMRGTAITMPCDRHEMSAVFPMTADVGTSQTTNNFNHDAEGPQMAFDAAGNPMVLCAWRNELLYGEGVGTRDLWLARWNTVSEEFVRHRLEANGQNMGGCTGGAFVKVKGRLIAIKSPLDWHSVNGYNDDAASWADLGQYPNPEFMVSDDDGKTWYTYNAVVNTAADGYFGGYIDGPAARQGQLIAQFMPLNTYTSSHVWEFNPLWAPISTGRGITTSITFPIAG